MKDQWVQLQQKQRSEIKIKLLQDQELHHKDRKVKIIVHNNCQLKKGHYLSQV